MQEWKEWAGVRFPSSANSNIELQVPKDSKLTPGLPDCHYIVLILNKIRR